MSFLTQVKAILSSDSSQDSKFEQIFKNAYSTFCSNGVSAYVVHYYLSAEGDGNQKIYEYMKYSFENCPEIGIDVKLEIFFFWLRGGNDKSITYQIKFLETFYQEIKKGFLNFEARDSVSNLMMMIIRNLLEKCEYLFENNEKAIINEAASSKEFLEKVENLDPERLSSSYKGRVYLITNKLKAMIKNLPSGKKNMKSSMETESNDTSLVSALKALPGGGSPLVFKRIEDFLKSVKCVPNEGRIKRKPAYIYYSLESITANQLQDPELCLQIAITSAIIKDDDSFDVYIKKFAKYSGFNGDIVISLIHGSLKEFDNNILEKDYFKLDNSENNETEEEDNYEPFLKPFDVKYEVDNTEFNFTIPKLDFKEEDIPNLFNEENPDKWCNARYCVNNLFEKLDPDSFALK